MPKIETFKSHRFEIDHRLKDVFTTTGAFDNLRTSPIVAFAIRERLLLSLSFTAFFFAMVIIKTLFFPSYTHASTMTMSGGTQASIAESARHSLSIPQGTAALFTSFQNSGSSITPLMNVSKPPLSVKGVLASYNDENIQVFEYADATTAATDAQKLRSTYTGTLSQNTWGSYIHIYQKDSLLVFYMGDKDTILKTFTSWKSLL